jgi:uncharacterized protein YcnI
MRSFFTRFFAAAYLLCVGTASFAHVVLQDGAAAANSSYRATFRVGHGCDGQSTTGMRITIPAGFNGAQPMPKAGWTLSTKTGPLAVLLLLDQVEQIRVMLLERTLAG